MGTTEHIDISLDAVSKRYDLQVQKLLAELPETHTEEERAAILAAAEFAKSVMLNNIDETTHLELFEHPVQVAQILIGLEMDAAAICAAILHNTYYPRQLVTLDTLKARFGDEVAGIVHSISTLSVFELRDVDEVAEDETDHDRRRRMKIQQAAAVNLRKILLAMSRDLRVIVLKLADRLHQLRSADMYDQHTQQRIAEETLAIYAPLSHRLGVWQLKWELEDLSFKLRNPEAYHQLATRVSSTRQVRERDIQRAIGILKNRLEREGINAEVQGRPKHLYSIYNKMIKEQLDLDQIFDLLALRVITETVGDCYHTLGIVHDLWQPIPNRFDDYIARPKSNLYQSIHTKVFGPNQQPLEVQIRTWQMHRNADFGLAAHWQYKEGGSGDDTFERRMTNLRQQLFNWQVEGREDTTFLGSVVKNLFSDLVFVFTPKGEVVDLVAGSTPIDFAYRVHTNMGNLCVGAKVNGRMTPVNTQLKNGDVVEIVTRSNAEPSRDWLNFVKTNHARSKIRNFFRKLDHDANVQRGRELLEKEAERLGLEPHELLRPDALDEIVRRMSFHDIDDVYAAVADGRASAQAIGQRLLPDAPVTNELITPISKVVEKETKLVVGGIDNVMIKRGRCCSPIPGDVVLGYTSRGRGLMMHRSCCPNAKNYQRTEPERLVLIEWNERAGEVFSATVRIEFMDRHGIWPEIISNFSDTKTNITSFKSKVTKQASSVTDICCEVTGLSHLQTLIDRCRSVPSVLLVRREGPQEEAL